MGELDVKIINDYTSSDGLRKVVAATCQAVCSTRIDIALDGDVIRGVSFTGGCHGNAQGISALCIGMKIKDVISRLEGINCSGRGTSCPDQLARVLKELQ